jgi:hypothetical protein
MRSERERDAWRGVERKERGEKASRSTTRRHSFMSRSAETSAVTKGDSASTDAESTDGSFTHLDLSYVSYNGRLLTFDDVAPALKRMKLIDLGIGTRRN